MLIFKDLGWKIPAIMNFVMGSLIASMFNFFFDIFGPLEVALLYFS